MNAMEKKLGAGGRKLDARKYMMVFALVGIWVVFAILSKGTYLMPRNISNLFRQAVFVAILAIGMINVIILGEIDLSVGSIAALCGGVLAILNVWYKVPIGAAVAVSIALGILMGLWNGWWVAYRGVPAFIVTLAGQLVYRGILVGVTNGITISPLDPALGIVGQEYIPAAAGLVIACVAVVLMLFAQWSSYARKKKQLLEVPAIGMEIGKSISLAALIVLFVVYMNAYKGVPTSVLIVVIMVVIFNFAMTKTVFGRRVYAIGGNKRASLLAGINIKKNILAVFALNGLIVSVGAIALTSRLDSAAVNAADGAELDAIAACVIGGTSMMGGVGTLMGAIIGALVISSIDNGMSLLDAPSFWQTIVKGFVLLLAVWFDVSRKRAG